LDSISIADKRGIVFISVLMQRNSPHTHVIVKQIPFIIHQESDQGNLPITIQEKSRWRQ
jgi:hypothetical protein